MENIIYEGKWVKNWFSNMMMCFITIDGITYNSVENYYQAMKSFDDNERKKIAVMSPSKSKYYTKGIKIRSDWEDVKQQFMYRGLWEKFNQPEWKDKLLQTGDTQIVEYNNWNDIFWGVDIRTNKGLNHLGRLLMEIRTKLKS